MRQLHETYKSEVVFLFVVVENGPHEPPALVQQAFDRAGLPVADADNRCSRAQLGVDTLELPFACVVDTPDRKVEALYDAYPERLVVVGGNGRIVLDAGRGVLSSPHGVGWDFEAVEAALRQTLAPPASHAG